MADKPAISYYPASTANQWLNQSMPKSSIVMHTMGGFFEGTRAWFSNPASSASTNFGASQDGRLDMYVDPAGPNSPFANGLVADHDPEFAEMWRKNGFKNPNYWTISIEHEDKLAPLVQITTIPSMFEASTLLSAWLCQTYGLDPNEPGVFLGHYQIDGKNRKSCPGWNAATWDAYINEVVRKLSVGGGIPAPVEPLTDNQRLKRAEALLVGHGLNNVWIYDENGKLGNDPDSWLFGDAALDFLDDAGSSAYQALFKIMHLMKKHGLWE